MTFLWGEISLNKHRDKLFISLAGSFSLENSASSWIKDGWEMIGPCFLKSEELK